MQLKAKTVIVDLDWNREADVTLKLPGGQEVVVQYRLTAPSIDICLPDTLRVTNWGEDQQPSFCDGDVSYVRMARQLVIDLPVAYTETPAQGEERCRTWRSAVNASIMKVRGERCDLPTWEELETFWNYRADHRMTSGRWMENNPR